jgi:hypothetical protein
MSVRPDKSSSNRAEPSPSPSPEPAAAVQLVEGPAGNAEVQGKVKLVVEATSTEPLRKVVLLLRSKESSIQPPYIKALEERYDERRQARKVRTEATWDSGDFDVRNGVYEIAVSAFVYPSSESAADEDIRLIRVNNALDRRQPSGEPSVGLVKIASVTSASDSSSSSGSPPRSSSSTAVTSTSQLHPADAPAAAAADAEEDASSTGPKADPAGAASHSPMAVALGAGAALLVAFGVFIKRRR